jgi:hypothetical protein
MRLSTTLLVFGLAALSEACVKDGSAPSCNKGDRPMCECNGGHKVNGPLSSSSPLTVTASVRLRGAIQHLTPGPVL